MPVETAERPGSAPAAPPADSVPTGAGAGSETPAGAAPERVAAAPERAAEGPKPGEGQPPAPAAAADSAGAGEPAGDKRVADAQRTMHAATERAAMLRKQLDQILGRPAAAASPTGEAAPAATTPAAPAAVKAEMRAAAPELSDATLDAIYDKWADKALDEKSAFKLMMREAVNLAVAQTRSLASDPTLVDQTYERILARAEQSARTNAICQSIESFWQESLPEATPQHMALFWKFADEAQKAHPGNLTQQALYCLESGLSLINPVAARTSAAARENESLTRSAAASLPGGGVLPGGAGGGEKLPDFVTQVRALRPRRPEDE